jgi:hypothetical protein
MNPKNPLTLRSDSEFFAKVADADVRETIENTDFISGHFGKLGTFIPDDFIRICVFRDPLVRVVSGYNHIAADAKDPRHEKIVDMPFCEAIAHSKFAKELSNHQARLICQNAGEAYGSLTDKQRIECCLDYLSKTKIVGLLEQPANLLQQISEQLGIQVPDTLPRINKRITSKGIRETAIYDCIDRVVAKNRVDIALYSAVRAKLKL